MSGPTKVQATPHISPQPLPEDPPWLDAFGQMAGIADRAELQRLHALAKLLSVKGQAGAKVSREAHSKTPAPQRAQTRQLAPQTAPPSDKVLHQAYSAQTEHMAMIACALGACPECWGLDPDCTQCVGEGRPGAFLPDERCFERFVLPVIQRILRDQKSPAPDSRGTSRTERHPAEHRSQS